jgi:hypothetical protein
VGQKRQLIENLQKSQYQRDQSAQEGHIVQGVVMNDIKEVRERFFFVQTF